MFTVCEDTYVTIDPSTIFSVDSTGNDLSETDFTQMGVALLRVYGSLQLNVVFGQVSRCSSCLSWVDSMWRDCTSRQGEGVGRS